MKPVTLTPVILYRYGNKFFCLPDPGAMCDCTIDKPGVSMNAPMSIRFKPCPRKSAIMVMGQAYMGIGNYCKQCYKLHCEEKGYPTLPDLKTLYKKGTK